MGRRQRKRALEQQHQAIPPVYVPPSRHRGHLELVAAALVVIGALAAGVWLSLHPPSRVSEEASNSPQVTGSPTAVADSNRGANLVGYGIAVVAASMTLTATAKRFLARARGRAALRLWRATKGAEPFEIPEDWRSKYEAFEQSIQQEPTGEYYTDRKASLDSVFKLHDWLKTLVRDVHLHAKGVPSESIEELEREVIRLERWAMVGVDVEEKLKKAIDRYTLRWRWEQTAKRFRSLAGNNFPDDEKTSAVLVT